MTQNSIIHILQSAAVDVEDLIEEATSRLSSIRKCFKGDAMKMTARESLGTALLLEDVITLLDKAKGECLQHRTTDYDSIIDRAQGGG